MACAHQRPLSIHLLKPPQQEAPQATIFLGLTKHRLDDRLTPGIDLAAVHTSELAGHSAFGVEILWDRTP